MKAKKNETPYSVFFLPQSQEFLQIMIKKLLAFKVQWRKWLQHRQKMEIHHDQKWYTANDERQLTMDLTCALNCKWKWCPCLTTVVYCNKLILKWGSAHTQTIVSNPPLEGTVTYPHCKQRRNIWNKNNCLFITSVCGHRSATINK